MLYCQSARTAFDLLLQTLSFPPGTEILISAITIPDIVAIMRCHGLVPVLVDLEPTHLTPSMESLKRGLNPKTRMLVVAHLFGSRFDMAPFIVFAKQHYLILIEDRAQAFDGTQGESLCLVEAPEDRPWLSPDTVRQLLETMVFVPVYPQMPDSELSRMAAEIRRVQTDRRP